jgi:hypothetical protein
MAKRGEKFERSPRDLYETVDPRAVAALLPYVDRALPFVEPCAGAGALVDGLLAAGLVCWGALDIEPLRDGIAMLDARAVRLNAGEQVITNPPFTRPLMHAIMWHCAAQVPSWFLVEADWLITQQAGEILRKHGAEVVAVGRLRWFREGDPRDKGNDPMDNFVWVKLVPDPYGGIIFWPRAAK